MAEGSLAAATTLAAVARAADKAERAADRAERAAETRDDAIRAAYAQQGATLAAVAIAAGMSRQRVHQIVRAL